MMGIIERWNHFWKMDMDAIMASFSDKEVKDAISMGGDFLVRWMEEYAKRTATPLDDEALKVLKGIIAAHK